MVGENLDLTSGDDYRSRRQSEQNRLNKRPDTRAADSTRGFLGIRFACCDIYTRIYANRDGTAYVGNCPRCQKQLTIGIGPGGSSSRFFTAY